MNDGSIDRQTDRTDYLSYRQVWMGIAILWVMLFHAEFELPQVIGKVMGIGYGGVDIFILSSGMGCYTSYTRDREPLSFIKRRIFRLAPVYVPFILVWCIYEVINHQLSPLYVVGNVLGIQGFSASGRYFNWYLICIITCYILTPYLAEFVRSHSVMMNALLVFIAFLISLSFINDSKLLIAASRLPIFVLGMLIVKEKDKLTSRVMIVSLMSFLFGVAFLILSRKYLNDYLWPYGLYWYPFFFMTPGLCFAISSLSHLFERYKLGFVVRIIREIGGMSFELFLIHIFLFQIIEEKGITATNVARAIVIVLALVISYIYHLVLKRCGCRRQKRV